MEMQDHEANSREKEFLALFAASQRPLHAYILALVFDANAAADLLQETNIVLWQKFDQFETGTNFFAWAREIARIAVLRHRQKTATRIATLDPLLLESLATRFSDATSEQPSEREHALDDCLKQLPDPDRDLILARYAPGASVNTMAKTMKRTANSVSQSLSRIRRTLMNCTQRRMQSTSQT